MADGYEIIYTIKKILQFLALLTAFLSNGIILLISKISDDVGEYTSANASLMHTYILLIQFLMVFHSILPHLTPNFLKKNIGFITNDSCKTALTLMISMIYWTSEYPFLLICHINFCCFFALLLFTFAFDCKILFNRPKNAEIEERVERI